MDLPLFAWLHLSDIHFGVPGAANRAHQELILADLDRALAEGMPCPDVIFVTGDVAFNGGALATGEYDKAREWLDAVAAALKKSRKDIYLVPGNHDVQRAGKDEKQKRRVLNAIRKGDVPLDDALSREADRRLLLSRMERYHEFARQYGDTVMPSVERLEAGRLDWSHVRERERGGLRVHLIGLNSALLANEEDREERGRLHLGRQRQAPDGAADSRRRRRRHRFSPLPPIRSGIGFHQAIMVVPR